jgi:DNA gyrase subunit A
MGRSTQGVTLINLSEGEKLSGMQRIMDRDDDNGENGGNGGNGTNGGTHGTNGGAEGTIAPEGEGGGPTTH